MHHYIITRFSILNPTPKGFSRIVTSEILFNKERLDFKFKVFDMMTYPSIKNQTCQNYTWLIFTSPELPEEYSKKIDSYSDSNIQIIRVNSFNDMRDYLKKLLKDKKNYSTIRLDDDDGLCSDFLLKLNKYENDTDKIVSFPYGRNFSLKDDKIVYGQYVSKKNIAIGLAAIGFSIYSAGDHTKINEKYEVIYDDTPNSYFLCCSEFCDTGRKFH